MRDKGNETMADRIKELTLKGDRAQARIEELDQQIAEGVADGLDDMTLGEMRDQRRRLVEECDDLSEAIALLEKRAADPAIKERAKAMAKARVEARRRADVLVTAAADVDAALAKLDQAFGQMQVRTNEMQESLRLAGLSDSGRLGVQLLPSLRWASWAKAPLFAEASQVPRAPANRRHSLRDSIARLIPAIPE